MGIEDQKRKRKKTLAVLIAVVCGILLVGCLSCFAIGSLVPDKPISTSIPTAVATVTYAWPEPEVVGPTSTASPLPTSRPTSTPQPTATNVDAEYIDKSMPLFTRYNKAFTDMSEWANSSSSYATFRDWAAAAVPKLAEVLIVGEEIRGLQPSPRFEASHEKFCDATEHYDAAVYLIADGLDTLDADLIDKAVEEMVLGTALVAEATELLPD